MVFFLKTNRFKGKERIISLISRPKAISAFNIRRNGVNWLVHGHDLNEFYIAVRKHHSILINQRINLEIAEGRIRTFWDVGANIGGVCLPVLKDNIDVKAILFEPSAEVAGRLIRNIMRNPDLLERITLMNVALSDCNGLVNFYASNETFNSGTAGLGLSCNRFTFPVVVQAFKGDDLIDSGKCPAPDLIKIDVEGFEINVLKGLRGTLERDHPTIIFEHSLSRLKEVDRPANEVVVFLNSIGYNVLRLDDLSPVSNDDLNKRADFLAKKIA